MNEYQVPRVPDSRYPSQPGFHAPAPMSAMAVAGLVLGIVALVTSALPIINNFSFLLALVGLVFAIVGLVATSRGTRRGKALAIAGLVSCIVSGVIVIASQGMYGAILDEATSGPSAVDVSSTSGQDAAPQDAAQPNQGAESQSEPQSDSDKADYSNMAVGESVELSNGLVVTVQSVQAGLVNYDESTMTGITVAYTNNSSSDASFNMFDWKAQDAQGAQRSTGYYSEQESPLDSGSLAPGGTVSGNLYFEGEISKVLYYSSIFSDKSTTAWNLS